MSATAVKLLNAVNVLDGMIQEIGSKQRILNHKMKGCTTKTEADLVKNAASVLNNEIDNINITLDLIEDLHSHLLQHAFKHAA